MFCNPPYGREIGKWVRKAYEEAQSGITVVLLIPARTDTSYFHEYIYGKAEIRWVRGRLRFEDEDGIVYAWTKAGNRTSEERGSRRIPCGHLNEERSTTGSTSAAEGQ